MEVKLLQDLVDNVWSFVVVVDAMEAWCAASPDVVGTPERSRPGGVVVIRDVMARQMLLNWLTDFPPFGFLRVKNIVEENKHLPGR